MDLKIFSYKNVSSTNEIAIQKIRKGFNKGIIKSDFQKNGKGRYGRKWISNKGNLFTSVFYSLNRKIDHHELLRSNCIYVKKILKKKIKKPINIKYPNDLLVNGEKICGILQEIINCRDKKFIIVGIGINIVSSPNIFNYKTTYVNRHLKKNTNKGEIFNILKFTFKKILINSPCI